MTAPTPDLAALVADMTAFVEDLADRVLRAPPEEREAEYARIRDMGYRAALAVGAEEETARGAGEQTERAARQLVSRRLN